MSSPIRSIVGLGNPGPRYAMTRHNAGFWFLDGLASRFRQTFRASAKLLGEECQITETGMQCRLFKPTTFMNESGMAVTAFFRYYRESPEQLLVVHDEIDLPPGTIRLKQGGGHGGHNGLRSIIAHMGTRDFSRLRIGVGHPGHRDEVVGYVLHPAREEEQTLIEQAIARAYGEFPLIARGELERVMNTLHT
uniref:Peptidyl-tRNA hydrolase n=1 Tax=Candidatus Kentrum sp. DK TaxID=2126562 RepID=A0A450SAA0_9GAMM|nr:MAG: peptidyl-tRNA hydrolase [Candidatus Kentron sp. DK]VFJ58789.1 MAG: peptidyl-tRNA hydrolase [Candidatus Kentron sp. DK]